jgi:Mg2+/Co2+ transporter CorB
VNNFQITLFSIFLILLILLAAFFSCAETGLMSVNRYRLRHKARMKTGYATVILKLLQRPDRLLGAILIGNTFANMMASSLATLLAAHFWGEHGAILAAIVLAFVVLIFAEIAPKTLAAIYPEKIARMVAYPIRGILKFFYPAVWLANSIANGLLRILHVRVAQHAIEPLSSEELRSVVYDATGKMPRQYQTMLLGILDLSKLTVDDVMIPRSEMKGVDIDQPLEAIADFINQYHQDWIPVYRDNINQVIGVLHTHEILRLFLSKTKIDKVLLTDFLQQPYFVPEGTSLNVQLIYFQQNQDKVAFVVDEYGEILGLLTVHDILEEIVGDFTSAMTQGKRIQQQPDGGFLVDGAMTVREFNRKTAWELPVGGPRTINGLIVEYLEALPQSGTTVLIAGYPIEIIQVKDNRVKLARVFPLYQTT